MAKKFRLRKMLAVYPLTELDPGPKKIEFYEPTYEVLIALDKDHTISLIVHQSDVDECPEYFEEVK